MKKLLLLSLALLTAVVVAGCGGDDESTTGAAAGNETDRAFVSQMIPHHESAVEMAEIAQDRGQSEFVTSLADDIVRTQTEEISTMREQDSELEDAGIEVGDLGIDMAAMGMDTDTAALKTANPFDPAFVDMMVPHHEDAVAMAKIELDQGEDPELKALAEDIVSAQEREIKEMNEFRGGASNASADDEMDMG